MTQIKIGAKSQIDFYRLNNEFQDVKAEAINIVLSFL